LINDRMDLAGARWHPLCAEAVPKLRSILSSGDFDEYLGYWELHEKAEAQRNQPSRYADGKVPSVAMPRRNGHLRLVRSVD
jgi:hypothetical protein